MILTHVFRKIDEYINTLTSDKLGRILYNIRDYADFERHEYEYVSRKKIYKNYSLLPAQCIHFPVYIVTTSLGSGCSISKHFSISKFVVLLFTFFFNLRRLVFRFDHCLF